MQTHAQKIRLAAQKAAAGTGRTAVAVRSVIRHFLASLHSLITILAAGAGAALGIVIVICLVAFVSGSAYGIFFAANAPNAASVTVREAVETLTAEYRDRLEEISDTVQHDRQDISDPSNMLDLFCTGNGNNDGKFSNADFDAAMEKAASTMDTAERSAALHQALTS